MQRAVRTRSGCVTSLFDPTIGLVVATDLEADPFLHAFMRECMPLLIAAKRWYTGTVISSGEAVADRPLQREEPGRRSRAVLVISGYDKTNAAQAATSLIERFSPHMVINFGIAGAFPGSRLGLRDIVVPTAEIYADTGASSPGGWLSTETFGLPLARVGGAEYWNAFPLDEGLVAGAERALREADWGGEDTAPDIAVGACVTLSQVTGRREEALELEERFGALAESMEGAACAHACTLYGVPFLEVRAVSNMVGHRDRAAWDLEGAAARAARAAAILCGRVDDLLANAHFLAPSHSEADASKRDAESGAEATRGGGTGVGESVGGEEGYGVPT